MTARAPVAERQAAGRAARDEGIDQVTDSADPRTILAIDAEIRKANESGEPWSANDIRDRFPVSDEHLVGARVRAAATRRPREQYPVDRVQSSLVSTHAHEIRVWQGAAAYEAAQRAAEAAEQQRRDPVAAVRATDTDAGLFTLLDEGGAG